MWYQSYSKEACAWKKYNTRTGALIIKRTKGAYKGIKKVPAFERRYMKHL